jgi:DNA-binding transcriptional LysR family regulator
VVDLNSFSRAAEKLFISQPALSQQIQRLERKVGARLLDRSVRPFRLTDAGGQVYMLAQRILENYRGLSEVTRRARGGEIGRVRVGVAPSLMFGPLPSVLRAFSVNRPHVDVVLDRFYTVEPTPISEGRLDVLFLFSRQADPGLLSHELYRDFHVVALLDSHELASHSEIDLEMLRHERFIMPPRQAARGSHDDIIAACSGAGFSPDVKEVSGSYLEHIGFVAAGHGIALVPEHLLRYPAPGVVYRQLAPKSIQLSINMCWSPSGLGAVTEAFIGHCIEEFDGFHHEPRPAP